MFLMFNPRLTYVTERSTTCLAATFDVRSSIAIFCCPKCWPTWRGTRAGILSSFCRPLWRCLFNKWVNGISHRHVSMGAEFGASV